MKLCYCGDKAKAKGLCQKHYWLEYRKAQALKSVKKSRTTVKNIPRQKPIAKVSSKQAKKLREYSKGKKAHFDEVREKKGYVPCMVGVEGICTGEATTWHHPSGRLGSKLLEFEEMIDACLPCHQFIETHPAFAKEQGFSVSRLNINNK